MPNQVLVAELFLYHMQKRNLVGNLQKLTKLVMKCFNEMTIESEPSRL